MTFRCRLPSAFMTWIARSPSGPRTNAIFRPSRDHAGSRSSAGSRVSLRFRGAMDASGGGAGHWSTSINAAASFYRFVQVEVTLHGLVTGEVPSLDTLVLPIR